MDIDLALAFVEAHGSALERARIRHIVHSERPGPAVLASLAALANADGGFPYSMAGGNLSTVGTTCYGLVWLDDLGLLASPTAVNACAYILATQRGDGGWDEDPAIARYDLPPWAVPGNLAARLYISAYAAYWLGVLGRQNVPSFEEAMAYLLPHQDEAGKFRGFLHSTWLATGAFAAAGPRYAEVVRKGLQCLLEQPLADWADSQLAWALDCLGTAGVPREHSFVERGLAELARRQRSDGGWSSEDGETYDVGATIQAVKVLVGRTT